MSYKLIFKPLIYALILLLIPFDINAQINPVDAFDSLFIKVQLEQVFKDQKKFPDCIPTNPVDTILKEYDAERMLTSFNLRDFVGKHFDTILTDTSAVLRHIDYLWSYLTRYPVYKRPISSLIPLPYPYVVPGGRFREIYYWDSYFTMLGLAESGKYVLIRDMTNNFCYLIKKYGHIPNGNRTYYLSRSQPPFFSLMVEMLAEEAGDSVISYYLQCMEQEYHFWMKGITDLNAESYAKLRVVRLQNEEILNRYWDSLSSPRPESYRQDVLMYFRSGGDTTIYRNIRATAESGWDFSSRWLKGDTSLTSLHTIQYIPVDLNCLLYHLELMLSKGYKLCENPVMSAFYLQKAEHRKELINKYFWNAKSGFYFDYNFKDNQQSASLTLAGVYPLFFLIADSLQAERVAATVRKKFLKGGGVVTSLVNTGQQWDFPNGWAPLQWITVAGLKNYGYDNLADSIARCWLDLNIKVFFETGKMMEKYDVVNTNRSGGGGEYPLQDGFGWTNGVFLKLWNEYKRQNLLE